MSRKHRNWKSTQRRLERSRKSGWNRDLYRNTDDSIIAGVCSGLAEYFGLANWIMRVLFVVGFLIFEGAMVIAYIICWLVMSPRSGAGESSEQEEERGFKPTSSIRLRRAQQRMRRAMGRVENMEAYVTSRQYELNKEFAKMEK